MSYTKFQDWQLVATAQLADQNDIEQFGNLSHIWFNKKSGEKTLEHPGKKYFLINRKPMRKRAEAKFQKDVLDQVDAEKIRYAQYIQSSHGHVGSSILKFGQSNILTIY